MVEQTLNRNNTNFVDISISEASIDLIKSKETLINSYLICNCMKESIPLKEFISKLEEELIKRSLFIANGNQRTAASILSIKPTTLNEKIKKFGIEKVTELKKIPNLRNFLVGKHYFLSKNKDI